MEWVWVLGVVALAALAALARALRRTQRHLQALQAQVQADTERQREVFDGLDTGLVVYDPDDRLVLWNRDFAQLYGPLGALLQVGLRFEDLLRHAVQQGVVPEARGREEAWIAERLGAHRHPGEPLLRQMPSGRWRRITERFLADGSLLSYSVDVTELVTRGSELEAARQAARLAGARLEDAIEALPAAFELYDAQDRVVMSNARMREMYPRVSHLLPQQPTFEALVRANAALGGLPVALSVEEWLADRLAQRRNPGAPRLVQATDGRWFRVHERRTREGGLVGVRIDVSELIAREQSLRELNTELDAANRRLAELSETDALTGIANRRQFDRRLDEEWARCQRHGLPLSLLLIDVDHFKRYNDHHGHPAGDACLRRIATELQGCVRRPDELLARYGGEEFLLLLPHTDTADALALAQRCLAAVDAADLPHGDSPLGSQVTLSIGVASHQPAAPLPDAHALLHQADTALYRAKHQGRHRVVQA
ncbi:MAG: diguanylate cyclase [Rubrivivax sp.]|nr:diguanylate cyclase [Rubrivivax sp.]